MKYVKPQLLTARILEVLGLRQHCHIVLVIDLDEAARRFVCETLRKHGYEVMEASDVEAAMQVLRQHRVHLVFSDVATSEQHGVETIQRMRRFFPDIKIVAMSREIPAEVLKMCSFLGADAALAKPIAADLLLKTTRRLLAA